MILLGILLVILGIGLFVSAFTSFMDHDMGWVPIPVGVIVLIAGVITIAYQADKHDCLENLPVVTQTETKWVGGTCYVKAKDGKFVPEEWIEDGYNAR